MEVIVELVGELLVSFLLVGVAYAVGSVVFLLMRAGRLSLRGLNPPADVVDPGGRRWGVRVGLAPARLRYRLSAWLFRMRPSDQVRRVAGRDGAPDRVDRSEIVHPSGLVEQFAEGAGIVVWAILAVAVVAIVVLLFEVVLVTVLASGVFAVRSVTNRWQCEVVTPDGRHFHVPAGSLRQAQEERERLRAEITAGVYRVPDAVAL